MDISKLKKNRYWVIVTTVLAVVVIAFSVRYVVGQVADDMADLDWSMLAPDPLYLSLAAGMFLVCVFVGSLIWTGAHKGMGGPLSWAECARSHCIAAVAGYLPGNGLKFAGKAYLTRRQGVSWALSSGAVLFEFAGQAATRAVVALTIVGSSMIEALGWEALTPYLPYARVAAWLGLLAMPLLASKVVALLGRREGSPWGAAELHLGLLWGTLLLMCANWILYGLGYALLMHALYPVRLDQVWTVVFSTTASFLVSLVMFFVPAGLAVREGVMLYTLGRVLPEVTVTAGALLSRLVLLVAEVLAALVASAEGIWRQLLSITHKGEGV